MKDQDILTIEGLSKNYGRLSALDGVSFSLQTGSIVALLGPNGAGKTTTFKCILGVTDFQGQVRVAGTSVRKNGKAVRRMIGYLPQTPAFSGEDTCREALRFLAELRGVPDGRVDELIDEVHLAEQRDMPVGQLSGGMRQRLALAAALLSDPPLLLLDEPTANLDVQSRDEFHALLLKLRGEGKTIVVSTHFVEHMAHLADRVVLLRGGKVIMDEHTDEFRPKPGKQFVVHLNGTASADFIQALKSIGVGEERITETAPGLEAAIARALNHANKETRS